MRKFYLFILGLFAWTLAFSQANVNQLFTQYPEVIIKFQIQDRSQLETLTRMISIDNVTENEVIAYTNREEFERFLLLNIPYEIVEKPVLTPEELNMMDFETIKKNRNDWNYYPNYQAYLDMMDDFVTNYPNLCRKVEIGTSVQNRKLLACVLSANVNVREAEPQVFLSSSMHGDELTGYVLMLRYIDYLLSNYGTNERVTYLLNNLEIWITPLANPDGTFKTGNNDVSGATRENANNVDLNRNYKDWKYGDHPDGKAWQKETLAFMALQTAESFVLGFNLHGGTEVCNYPWDNNYALTADDAWWQFVCREYVDTVHVYNPNYFTGYNNGIVRGCNWYVISGGRQDYTNYYDHTREVTVEISTTKTPAASALPNYWNWNYRSFLNYTQQATYGIHGVVTDACTGEPVYAKVFINSHDVNESYIMTDPRVGYYARPIKGGTYSITYSADGYVSQTVSVTVADRQKVVKNIVLSSGTSPTEPPVADFTADITVITEGVPTTVHFSDMSQGCNSGWLWYFEEGTPETSTEKNPVVTYNAGKSSRFLDVQLKVTNAYGEDTMLKENYIEVGLPPVSDFTADPTTVVAGNSVSFFDLSENDPASWAWTFEGGTPEKSAEQNPVILYKNPGSYYVKLLTKNAFGQDIATKENYIIVTVTVLPIADFEADKTKIYENKSVNFTDLSLNATAWKWYFEGGTPETSTEQNPTILYQHIGSYSVTLVAENESGKDSLTKEHYITVVETTMPIADFVADETHITAGESVRFTSLSENATTWEWYFEGGTPETSTEEHPTVVYEKAGCFDVKLTVTNANGNDMVLKEDYITVDNVGISEINGLKVKVFPNPVSQRATITIEADSPLRKIEWINMAGAPIKTVYTNAASHTFSVSDIEQGVYLLKIETAEGISVTKIQVQ